MVDQATTGGAATTTGDGAATGAGSGAAGNAGATLADPATATATARAAGTASPAGGAAAANSGVAAADTGTARSAGDAAAAGNDTTAADTSTSGAGDNWDAKWRENYAGTDDKKLGVLKRYASPSAALDALFAARQRFDSGELKPKLPENATAEQLTAYRKDNGIPDTADGYLAKLPQGAVDDATKAMLTPYLEAAHKVNASPETVNAFIAARQAQIDKIVETQVAQDNTHRTQVEDDLRAEWGRDYTANRQSILNMLAGAPPEVSEEIQNARLPDGRALFNSKQVMQYFAQMALNSGHRHATIMDGSGNTLEGKGIDNGISELDRWMASPKGSAEYNRYWADPKAQELYRSLLDEQANRRRAR